MFKQELRSYSKQVQSLNNSDVCQKQHLNKKINESILQKYLSNENHPIITCFENCILRFRPYFSITQPQIIRNLKGVLFSDWSFDYITENEEIQQMHKQNEQLSPSVAPNDLIGKNISIYFVIWGPISTMFFANLFHNEPFSTSKFQILSVGLLNFMSILIISFAMYVYCNVLQTPYTLYCQHLCVSSFVGLLSIVFASICAAAPDGLLIPFTIIYACLSIYLHFNLYNQSIKPTLIQMIILFIIFAIAYIAIASAYYQNFSGFWKQAQTSPKTPLNATHLNATHLNATHHFYPHLN